MEPSIDLTRSLPAPPPFGAGPLLAGIRNLAAQRGLVNAAGWSLAAAVVARGSNLAALIACARLLPQAEFGQVAIIQSTVGMFAPIASLGLAMTSAKFLAEFRDSDPMRAGRILGLSLMAAAVAGSLMTLVLIALAPWIAARGFASPDLSGQLIAASGLLALGVIESAQAGALAGLGAFSEQARAGAWSGAVSIPLIALLSARYGARGAITGLTLALGITCVLNALALRGECRRFGIRATIAGAFAEREVLFRFSLPSYLSGLMIAPVAWLANTLLVKGTGGFSELAVFSAADRFRYLLIFLPLAVSRTTVPTLVRLRAAGDAHGYASALRWNLIVAVLVTGVPALACIAAAGPLMALFGELFRSGWLVLAVLAFSAIPTVLNTQLGAVLLSDSRVWERAACDALLAVAFLALAWWAVPQWGALGLAASFAAAYSLAGVVLSFLAWRST